MCYELKAPHSKRLGLRSRNLCKVGQACSQSLFALGLCVWATTHRHLHHLSSFTGTVSRCCFSLAQLVSTLSEPESLRCVQCWVSLGQRGFGQFAKGRVGWGWGGSDGLRTSLTIGTPTLATPSINLLVAELVRCCDKRHSDQLVVFYHEPQYRYEGPWFLRSARDTSCAVGCKIRLYTAPQQCRNNCVGMLSVKMYW